MEEHIIWYMLGELGILTGFVALLFRRFEKKLDKRDKEREEKENAKLEHDTLTLRLNFASLTLAEATAEAVQRIPDAHCNGDMHTALEKAKEAKAEYRKFETERTVKSLR